MRFVTSSQPGAENADPLRILVVDDDLLSQHLMRILLAREGYHVEVASNGLEAFDVIQRQRFDIVFMDLQMPMMDGLETSRRIREWEAGQQHTFIVALTASYFADAGQRLAEAGIDDLLGKPFEIEHIQRVLKQ